MWRDFCLTMRWPSLVSTLVGLSTQYHSMAGGPGRGRTSVVTSRQYCNPVDRPRPLIRLQLCGPTAWS